MTTEGNDGSTREVTSEEVATISRNTELTDLRAVDFGAKLETDPPPVGAPVTGALGVTITIVPTDGEFQLQTAFKLRVYEVSKTEKDAFLTARYVVVTWYRHHDGFHAAEEQIRPFASVNGMIHVWPYFRAFVQQACGQLSISPVVIPPFRAGDPIRIRFVSPGSTATPAADE